MNEEKIILQIAQKHFDLKTLEERGSDDLDFFETSVWNLKEALMEAFKLGKASK